jgi:hypothetical protein
MNAVTAASIAYVATQVFKTLGAILGNAADN